MLSLLACGTVAAANAQAGSILVYGNAGISASKPANAKPTKTLDFNITPGVGYQFNKNWTAGLYGNYETNSQLPDGGDRFGNRQYTVGVFGRYSCPVSPIFTVFGQVNGGYMSGHSFDGDGKIAGTEFHGFEVGFAPAVQVFVTKGFALNFAFGGVEFNSVGLKDADYNTTSFDLTFGQQFNIGISKNFGCGHKAKKGHHEPMDETRHMDTADDEDDAPKKKKAAKDDDE